MPALSLDTLAMALNLSVEREREVEEGEESAGQREERTWVEQGEIMEQEYRTNHYYSDPTTQIIGSLTLSNHIKTCHLVPKMG